MTRESEGLLRLFADRQVDEIEGPGGHALLSTAFGTENYEREPDYASRILFAERTEADS